MIIIIKKIDIIKWMKKRQLRRNKNKFKRVSLAFFGLVIILAGALFLFWPKGTTLTYYTYDYLICYVPLYWG